MTRTESPQDEQNGKLFSRPFSDFLKASIGVFVGYFTCFAFAPNDKAADQAVAVYDVNRDGRDDVVVTNLANLKEETIFWGTSYGNLKREDIGVMLRGRGLSESDIEKELQKYQVRKPAEAQERR